MWLCPKIFSVIKKKIKGILKPEQNHGMLVYDEMFLRESFNVIPEH